MSKNLTMVICVEDNHGYTFCNKPLSMDKELIAKMLEQMPSETPIYIGTNCTDIHLLDNPDIHKVKTSREIPAGSFVYVSEPLLMPNLIDVNKIILFRWHRRYPATAFFFEDKLEDYTLIKSELFSGSSHEELEMLVFERQS